MYYVIIIGAGPAGLTAAIYAKRANMKVLLLDRLAPGGQMINTAEIENYPGTGTLAGADLAMKMYEHTMELGVEFAYNTVVSITKSGTLHTVHCLEEEASYSAQSLIIATGTVPRRLEIPGESTWAGNGISWCAICDGAQFRGKRVVVIGGGNSAVEESIFLAEICTQVTVVTMFDLTADPKSCQKLRNLSNVTVYTYQNILEFLGTKKLEGVRFVSSQGESQERTVECDGVFEYIGFQASSEAFSTLGITNSTGCIEVDARMRTAVPGIFGAGDITVKHLRQIVTACNDGAIAANSAATYVQSLRP